MSLLGCCGQQLGLAGSLHQPCQSCLPQQALLSHLSVSACPPLLQAKAGAGSATLSMAAAAARFAASCLRAMGGDSNVVECAYVASSMVSGLPYFASPLRLGPAGIAGA